MRVFSRSKQVRLAGDVDMALFTAALVSEKNSRLRRAGSIPAQPQPYFFACRCQSFP